MPVARIDINRIDIAVVLSLLVHGLIAAIPVHQRQGEKPSQAIATTFIAKIVDPAVKAEPAPLVQPETPVVRPRSEERRVGKECRL